MPVPEKDNRFQDALLWVVTGRDKYDQLIRSASPIELRVRWIRGRRTVRTQEGNTLNLDASAIVDREIELGSQMWLGGNLDDLIGTGTGTQFVDETDPDLYEVVFYDYTKDIKGREIFHEVGLARTRERLEETP